MARSEVCKNCCPRGGALFTLDFGCWPHHSTKEEMLDPSWVKVCNNCGHYKPQRKRQPRMSFDEILAQPDDGKLRNKNQRAIFHAFAESGAWGRYAAIANAYEAQCEARGITRWPLLMHKWKNDYHYKKLTKRERLSALDVNHHVRSLKEQVQRAQEVLNRDFPESKAA